MAARKETDNQSADRLNELEQLLASFPPRASRLGDAELMYAAGRAAAQAETQLTHRWSRGTTCAASLAGMFAIAAAVLLTVLVNRPVRIVERVVDAPPRTIAADGPEITDRQNLATMASSDLVESDQWRQLRTMRDRQFALALAESARFDGAPGGAESGDLSPYYVLQRQSLRSDALKSMP